MHIISNLPQQARWLGGKKNNLHPWGSRSIPTNDMGCGQCWNVDQIFFTCLFNIG